MNPAVSRRLRWSYAINAWKPGFMGFARREEHERAFKVTSAAGFRAVELNAGSGRWEPLGRPENVRENYGTARQFLAQLQAWGINEVSSLYYDPGQMSFEDLHHGLSPLQTDHHDTLLATAMLYARFLGELGAGCLVVRPVPSFWKTGALDAGALRVAADCWNAAARGTAACGVRIALHVDALSGLRTPAEIAALLELTDPAHVGLALDTAEVTIAGHDAVELYERFADRVIHVHYKNALARDTLEEFRLPNAERALMQAGGQRGISRWFAELGHPQGLVDFPTLTGKLRAHGYAGWIVVESDKGPAPVASGVLLNGWTVQRVLDPA